jgi:serine/threonine protein phosphatase PrpC
VTATTSWKSFGASVIGPGHIAVGKPNQDAWSSFHHLWGDGIVVSDGLGSKALSDYGSDAACWAVEQAVHRFSVRAQDTETVADGQYPALLADILRGWLDSIAPLDPKDSSATCLFAFRLNDGLVRMGILGDGCAAVVKHDGAIVSLSDGKTTGFSNTTSALSPSTSEASWKVLDVPEADCEAVILCTDGVSDDLEDPEGFLLGFVTAYRGLAQMTAFRKAREMLEHWPAPKHSDDKTIACLIRAEVSDE